MTILSFAGMTVV